jgi:dienelactone hydrolase
VSDPNLDGPFAITELDETVTVAATTDSVDVHVALPTTAGAYPLVLVGHGLSLPTSEYSGYVQRLASFGYVAMTVDFPASVFSVNNTSEAQDFIGVIDWARSTSSLAGKVDATRIGVSGHSLGGKIALLTATMDTRVKAAFVMDPVDSGGPLGCSSPTCIVVKSLMPGLHIPTGFIGETTDASGAFQNCAPAADNYTTFYAQANTPSLQVTAVGANHMSFLDDVTACGLTCSVCQTATASNASINDMARAFMVAFYERHLRGLTGYDAYLTGAQAQSRYVTPGAATITSK